MSEVDVAAKLKEKNRRILWKPTPDRFGSGVPDRCCKFRGEGGEVFWAELKFVKHLPKVSAKVGLKSKQASWLQEWKDAGGNSFLIVGVGELNKVAIFCKDFRCIARDGIARERYDLCEYDEVSKSILRMING